MCVHSQNIRASSSCDDITLPSHSTTFTSKSAHHLFNASAVLSKLLNSLARGAAHVVVMFTTRHWRRQQKRCIVNPLARTSSGVEETEDHGRFLEAGL